VASKRDVWRDARVAGEYEARRFATPLQRLKHARDVRAVLDLLGQVPTVRSVLDLPCGTGRLLPALRAAGYRATGADVALEMLRAGRTHRPGETGAIVQADVERLPFHDAAFDGVVSLRFLFHLEDDERRRGLAEMRRVTRDGVLVAQVRYRWTLKQLARWLRSRVGLARRYRRSQGRAELAHELASAGFELVALRPISRLFSDKALVLARPANRARASIPTEVQAF